MSTAPVRADSAEGSGHVPRRRGVAFVHGALLILAPIEIFTAILILTGVRVASWIPVIVGLLLLTTLGAEVVLASRVYLRSRRAGSSRGSAVRALVRESVPAPVARFARFELLLWESVVRWVTRRPVVPDGGRGFTYHRHELPVLIAFAGLGIVEIAVVHWLLPWPVARIIALVLGVMGVLWVLGFLASLSTRPHHVTDTAVTVRVDARSAIRIDRSRICNAVTGLAHASEDGVHVAPTSSGSVASVVRHGQTNLTLALSPAALVNVPGHGDLRVGRLSFWVDDPEGLRRYVREYPQDGAATSEP